MRKLILISAFVSASILASVSVQAGEGRNLTLAANDEPAAVETTKPDDAVKADTAKPEAKPRASSSTKTRTARRESDEQKARRIAAKYGVSW